MQSNFNFNLEYFFVCSQRVLSTFNTATCISLQSQIYSTILGSQPTNVATFGNSDTNNPGSWIQIYGNNQQNDAAVDVNLNGVCNQMITSASILVAYANVGNIANPQPKIVYVGYTWGSLQSLRYQCNDQLCTTQSINVLVSTQVSFVDVSQPPNYIETNIVVPYVRLPQDFFYPFTSSRAANLDSNNFALSSILVTIVLISKVVYK